MSRRVREWRAIGPAAGLGLVAALIAVAGCDGRAGGSDGAVGAAIDPGAPPILPADLGAALPPGAGRQPIAFIGPDAPDPIVAMFERSARVEAGRHHAAIESSRAVAGSGPAGQAEAIRAASRSRAAALIVATVDPAALAESLAEVRSAGTPVVLIEGSADGPTVPADAAPWVLVARGPDDYREAARRIVAAARDDAALVGFTTDDPALILVKDRADRREAERAAALIEAAREAGLPLATPEPLVFAGTTTDAKEAVVKAMGESTPHKIAIVLATEDLGLIGANVLRESLTPATRYVAAGFADDPANLTLATRSFCSAVADCNPAILGRAAVDAALDLVAGKPLPARLDLPIRVIRAPGPPAVFGTDKLPESELTKNKLRYHMRDMRPD